jgi:2-amino-4-hydroxy-6-hydroxymethyldihydropteridine diphosphokinase
MVDVDILLADETVTSTERLTVPHPRFALRMFVLAPLAEIAGDWRVPPGMSTVTALRDAVNEREPDWGTRVAGQEWAGHGVNTPGGTGSAPHI